MKVLSMSRFTDEEQQSIRNQLEKSAEIKFFHDLNDNQKDLALSEADIVMGGRLSDEQLEKAKNLKMQQTGGTGVDRHNIQFFNKNNIILCNNHAHSIIIAEYAFSMLNAASKEFIANDALLRKGDWSPRKYPSVTLFDKKLLFVGFGKIASHIKEMCEPFKMKFLAIKRTEFCEDTDVEIFLPDRKIAAIQQADFIVNTLPKTENTIDFISKDEFAVMKPSTILINVGRGGTINEEAMYIALKEKKIKGAAIDVWYNYPKSRGPTIEEPEIVFPSSFPFQDLKNIIMTAHRAWVTDYSWSGITSSIVENVNRFIRGETPENIVNLEEGY